MGETKPPDHVIQRKEDDAAKRDSGAGVKPPERSVGMRGPDTPDAFGSFGDFVPPALRSQIDEFTAADAEMLLDDSMDAVRRTSLAALVRRAIERGRRLPSRPHGGHRFGTGWAKSEFPAGWGEAEVLDWVYMLVGRPLRIAPLEGSQRSFQILRQFNDVFGVVRVRPVVEVANSWYISTAHPADPAVLWVP